MSKITLMKLGFGAIHKSGLGDLMAPHWSGQGVIFCLHHVVPGGGQQTGFAPNSNLEVTPEFLETIILAVKARGYELLPLGDAVERLKARQRSYSRFAVFTLDDGYRDNLLHAMPVFKRNECPFTVYVAPKIADGTCELWWRGLEALIAKAERLTLTLGGDTISADVRDVARKRQVWKRLAPLLQHMPEFEQRDWMRRQAVAHDVDLAEICRAAAMNWAEIRTMVNEPLATIGAHTMNHYNLMKLNEADCQYEMVESRKRIEAEIKRPVVHFAYPYGNRDAAGQREFRLAAEAGFQSSVVTRLGTVETEHADHLQALPRIMVSGRYQNISVIEALLSGVPGRLANRLKRLNVT